MFDFFTSAVLGAWFSDMWAKAKAYKVTTSLATLVVVAVAVLLLT